MKPNLVPRLPPSRFAATVLCLLCLYTPAHAAPADAVTQLQGQRVTDVRVVGESGNVLEDNPAGVALQAGMPFSVDAERETLRELYRTGRYSDLVAEASPAGGGVQLA